jgi:hypothetical protein
MVAADIEPAHIVAYDEENVWWLSGTALTVAGYRTRWEHRETQGKCAQR